MGTISQITIEGMVIQLDAKKVNGFNVEKDVPSNALFTDTTYNVGAGLEIQNSQTQSEYNLNYTIGHSNNIFSGTAGTSSSTSSPTISVPYLNYDSEGHIISVGNRTHTFTGFVSNSGGTFTGDILRQNSAITLNTTNNGVNETVFASCGKTHDSNNLEFAKLNVEAFENGDIDIYLKADNKTVGGVSTTGNSLLGVHKDGTRYYYNSSIKHGTILAEDVNAQEKIITKEYNSASGRYGKRYGNVVFIYFDSMLAYAPENLPTDLRPNETVRFPVTVRNNVSDTYYKGYVELYSSGFIAIYYINGTIRYRIDDSSTSRHSITGSGSYII